MSCLPCEVVLSWLMLWPLVFTRDDQCVQRDYLSGALGHSERVDLDLVKCLLVGFDEVRESQHSGDEWRLVNERLATEAVKNGRSVGLDYERFDVGGGKRAKSVRERTEEFGMRP